MISVIIPSYNRKNTLEKTIRNILLQSYSDLELIVIDDCSIDGTEEMIKSFNDSRISYYRNAKNMGACYSRNRGIELAKGDYIAFQDSDDLWDVDKLKKQLSYLQNTNADMVFCALIKKNLQNTNSKVIPDRDVDKGFLTFNYLLKGNVISTQTILAKKNIFKNIRFDNSLPRYQDWDLVLQISKKYNIVFLNEVLCTQNISPDSISENYDKSITALNILFKKYFCKTTDKIALKYYYELLGYSYLKLDKNIQAAKSYAKSPSVHSLKGYFKVLLSLLDVYPK